MRLLKIYSLILWAFCSQRLFSIIEFSSKTSQLTVNTTGDLATTGDIPSLSGTVVVEAGGKISGGKLYFTGGTFGSEGEDSIEISGNFFVDATTQILQNLRLGENSVTFQGNNTIVLHNDLDLKNTWNFTGNANVKGSGLSLNLANAAAQIAIAANATLTISNATLLNFSLAKISFVDSTSVLNVVDSKISLAAPISQSAGTYTFSGFSTIVLNNNNVLLTNPATLSVSSGATLWLDNRGSSSSPVFAMLVTDTNAPSGFVQVSLINNTTVKILTDQSQVIDPGVSSLTSGQIPPIIQPGNPDTGIGAPIELTASAVLKPDDQIIVNNNVEISGSGTSITFSNTSGPQIVIPEGKTATFGDIELLRITQSTFDLQDNSTIRLRNNSVLEFVEDVSYDRGQFVMMGNNGNVLLRGLGGRKKISLKSNADGGHCSWSIGSNNLVLEDIEIEGLERFDRTSQSIDGVLYEGKMILTGQAKVNVNLDSDMHFLIRGETNKIVFQNNNLTLDGKIRFADGYDTTLHIGFNTDSVNSDLVFQLGRDALLMSCSNGQCGVLFENDKVGIFNKTASSFVVRTKSFLSGGVLTILNNPIIQQTSAFALATGTEIETSLTQPILFQFEEEDDALRSQDDWNFRFVGESTKAIRLPRPALVVKSPYASPNTSKAIGVRSGGSLVSFSTNRSIAASIIVTGNTSISNIIRRTGKVTAQVVRDVFSGNTETDTSLDTFKPIDKLYVIGTNNVFKVTGLLEFAGKIIMDEGAELIFRFDDSVDVVKAVKFTSDSIVSALTIPKKASIVFEGNGSVFFGDGSVWTFEGTPLSDQPSIGNGVLVDDRASLIFRNFAQLMLDADSKLTFKGKGKLLLQDGAQLKIEKGSLLVGSAETDFFDILADKSASLSIGSDELLASSASTQARVSLAFGIFNLRFDREAKLQVKNKGVFEIGLFQGVFNPGTPNQIFFARDSKMNIFPQGMFALGYESLSLSESLSTKFAWDNISGSMEGDGVIALFTKESSSAKFSSKLQNKKFIENNLNSFQLFKNIVKKTAVLIKGCDFIEASTGQYQLITSGNVLVPLDEGDVIRVEGPTSGNIYGTSAGGIRFGILPDGTKEYYS